MRNWSLGLLVIDSVLHLVQVRFAKTVVFPEATIEHGELRRSLIDTDTHLESLNLSGAVIGAHTRLNRG